MPFQVTVIIPAFNESASIGSVIDDLRTLPTEDVAEIVVVDDGSSDDTADVALRHGATVLRHQRNLGYGRALRTGIRYAQTAWVATVDADGQHRAGELHRLLAAREGSDMVVGQRVQLLHSPLWRMPGKWLLGAVANQLTGRPIPDLNSGLRVIRREVALKYLHLCPSGFSTSTTLTVALLSRGWQVAFVPIAIAPRQKTSTSQVSIGTGLDTIVLVLRLIALFNPLRIFVPASALAVLAGVAWGLPFALAGRGVSVGAMLAIVTGVLLFGMGLICDQLSQLRLERDE